MEPSQPSIPQGQQPFAAQVVPESRYPAPRRKVRILGPLVLVFLVLALTASVVMNMGLIGLLHMSAVDSDARVQEKHFSHEWGKPNKVAILSVEGTILSGEGFFKQQIDRARKDENVKAIVLRVNSPGGTISGSDYMYHHLKRLREEREVPIVVSMGGIAASGGYYISMAVGQKPDTIFAEPTTFTGSIGVIIPHYDLSKMLNNWGVEEDSIASHRLKGMGSLTKPMTEEERKIFQSLVDDDFARFKQIVQDGRPKFKQDSKALERLATGQVFSADQALAGGLIDKIGFVEDAVDRAIELAGLDKKQVEVVRYKPEPSLADLLIGAKAQKPALDLAAILDMTVPRAYYLCTMLPPVATSNRGSGE
jgi:protease-4